MTKLQNTNPIVSGIQYLTVPKPNSVWKNEKNICYKVLFITNIKHRSSNHVPQVVYINCTTGARYSNNLDYFYDKMSYMFTENEMHFSNGIENISYA